jgi:hypothetical protein
MENPNSPSHHISPLNQMMTDEMTVLVDAEFFDCPEYESNSSDVREVCVNHEVESPKISSLDLGFDESQQKIPASVTIALSGQPTLDPEILSILSKYPHYIRPATLPDNEPFGIEVFFYPPMPWMDLNERLHCLDEYFEYDLPDILRAHPTTLYSSVVEGEHLKYQDESELRIVTPTRLNTESRNHLLESKTDLHLGNSLKPNRRIDIYANFLKYLKISDFPFTCEQRKTFVEIDRIIRLLRANHSRKDELLLKSELDLLMDLLASTDYSSMSQPRINRYVAALINELEFWIERSPIKSVLILSDIPFFVDPATYLTNELRAIFPESTEEAMDAAFFAKRKQIHIQLIQLFQKTKFPFTNQQKIYIKELSQAVHTTYGNPDSSEETKFVDLLSKLLYDLSYLDTGFRDGISNQKKVKREFNRFVDALLQLSQEEREFLTEFERYYIYPADLVYYVIRALRGTFISRYTLSLSEASTVPKSVVSDTIR